MANLSSLRLLRQQNVCEIRQRFVDAIVLITAPDWSKGLSKFENTLGCHSIEFNLQTSNDGRFGKKNGRLQTIGCFS